MNRKLVVKLGLLNFGIAIVDILAFSNVFMRINLGDDTLVRRAFGYTLILMSIILFCYGNYRLLYSKETEYEFSIQDLNTPEDMVEVLTQLLNKNILNNEINTTINQIKRLLKKKESLKNIIYINFKEEDEDAYGLKDIINKAENLLYSNVKSMINAISVFDQSEFNQINQKNNSEKHAVYMEQVNYIREKVNNNETILLEFDKLLMQLSKLSDGTQADSDDLVVFKDVVNNMKNLL
ncbi:hypothetical protein [Anaerosporobacter sp.]